MSKTPTSEEYKWMTAISGEPCCINNGDCCSILQLHHITSGGRRLGHLFTIPLCNSHHHWDSPLPIGDAFHKGKKAWEAKHGSQMEHLRKVQERLGYDESGKHPEQGVLSWI